MRRYFVAYFFYNGLNINLGISLSLTQPNLEIHVPFGFFKIGWVKDYLYDWGEEGKNVWGYNTPGVIVEGKTAKVRFLRNKKGKQ